MQEKIINQDKAAQALKLWQNEDRTVEVRIHFSQGITQTHPGYVTVEPDGRVVVAHVVDRDHYLTTVIELSTFKVFKMIESENAIIFTQPQEPPSAIESVMLVSRDRANEG